MLLIGLTGGMGSGKSTVAELLEERGAVIVDADRIVHELQAPGMPVFEAMVDHFGPEIVRPDGTLDRQAVADRVFGDDEQLAALNAIVHPAAFAEVLARIEAHTDTDDIVILDVPLLVETGTDNMAAVVVVDVDPEVAVQRLVTHRGVSEEDAWARIARQASREERLARADRVVDNAGDRAALHAQVDELWAWLQERAVTS